MVRAATLARRRAVPAIVVGACVLLAGCSSMQQPEVEQAATTFEDPGADPETRCDLLAPATLAAFEEEESASCAEAIEQVPLEGGDVESVEIWGGDAQVRLGGDTVFLTETRAGWRITAASCQPRGEAPYDCEVEGP
jgi:outer membrane murein-binding lipoprotein Lpp